MMALGQHLRTYQDAGYAAVDGFHVLIETALEARGISVNANDWVIWKFSLQQRFSALGAEAYACQICTAATRALLRQGFLRVAMMATQAGRLLMKRITAFAARAFGNPAAVAAQQQWCEATTVEKY